MAQPFSRLISEFNKHAVATNLNALVHGQAAETWGARNHNSRTAIRESLKNSFSDWNSDDYEALKSLSEPPRPFTRSVSISHTHDFGGWMAIARPAQIGWDVELKARIKDSIIERVCVPEELDLVPHKYLLWGAKEAYYKALEDEQPAVIQQLKIDEWKSLAPGLWSWRGLGPRNGEGLVLDSEPWTLAACLIR
ncbi:MAG: 4'-phosphopantetheinyl transferase superfamily protein [Bdellovibrionales bacterium]